MTESEVLHQIHQLWPGLGDHARYVLWNHTCFPLKEGDDPLKHWLNQVDEYVKESGKAWQDLYG
jgi:hypothetical protein